MTRARPRAVLCACQATKECGRLAPPHRPTENHHRRMERPRLSQIAQPGTPKGREMPSSTMMQHDVAEREFPAKDRKTGMRDIRRIVLVTGLLILVAGAAVSWQRHSGGTSAPPAPPPPQVTVGTPLQETVA